MKKYLLILLIFLFAALGADELLKGGHNPEILKYRVIKDDEISFLSQETSLIELEGSLSYQIITESDEERTEQLILKEDFIPRKHISLTRGEGGEFLNQTEVRSLPQLNDNELFVVNMRDLAFLLRKYPFSEPKDLKVRFPGQRGDDDTFTLTVEFMKKETIKIGSRKYEAYKLELVTDMSGPFSVFARFFPGNYYWFSTEAPHIMLKHEGAYRGSDVVVTELTEEN